MEGWVKLHRKLIDWEWIDEPITLWVFIKCLLLANHADKKWKGVLVERGSFITSYEKLSSKKAKVTVMQVRTAIKRLILTGEITIKTTNKYTYITINNWDIYQDFNKQNNKQITNKQQTNNKQITTNKNDKNEKNEKNNNLIKFLSEFNRLFNKGYKITKGRENKLKARLKTYSLEEILQALKAMSEDPFYCGKNDRGWQADPDFLIRSDEQIDKFLNKKVVKKEEFKKLN